MSSNKGEETRRWGVGGLNVAGLMHSLHATVVTHQTNLILIVITAAYCHVYYYRFGSFSHGITQKELAGSKVKVAELRFIKLTFVIPKTTNYV